MINKNILSSIFDNYDIHSVKLVQDNNILNFIISQMPSSISLERWDYLENILKDVTGKTVNILPYNQAIKCFSEKLINEGLVIK